MSAEQPRVVLPVPLLLGLLGGLVAVGCDAPSDFDGVAPETTTVAAEVRAKGGNDRSKWPTPEPAELRFDPAPVPFDADLPQAEFPGAHTADAERQRRQRPDRLDDGDPCNRCGGDMGCRLMCFSGEAEFTPAGDLTFDCLECGRETGFLGQPDLTVEFLAHDSVRLAWQAVEGAEQYGLHGFRWIEESDRSSAHQNVVTYTPQTEVVVTLDREYVYAFYVVAWSADRKTRSLPSRPVRIDPDP